MKINLLEQEKLLVEKELYSSLKLDSDEDLLRAFCTALNENKTEEERNIIRFTQGEQYYHMGDYEAAIFKWEKAEESPLSHWSLKNIGDAYRQDGRYDKAEEYYHKVVMKNSSDTLYMETLLALFDLYISLNKLDLALKVLKETVKTEPDYKNVSVQALDIYEEHQLWNEAAFLIINEVSRTGTQFWIWKFTEYIDEWRLQDIKPEELMSVLPVIMENEDSLVNEVIEKLWSGYKGTEYYLDWLKAFHFNFPSFKDEGSNWSVIGEICSTEFQSLLLSDYEMDEIIQLIPQYLVNWWSMAEKERRSIRGFILAWEEVYSYSFEDDFLVEVRDYQIQANEKAIPLSFIPQSLTRFMDWLKEEAFTIPPTLRWELEYLGDYGTLHLVITGTFSNGKSSIINSLLGEDVLETEVLPTTSAMIVLSSGAHHEMIWLRENEWKPLTSMDEFKAITTIDHQTGKSTHTKGFIHYQLPNLFLEKNKLKVIDSPGYNDEQDEENKVLDYLNLGDGILFVLNARTPFTKEEMKKLTEIMDKQSLPLHFILNKIDIAEDEDEKEEIIEDTQKKVRKYFKGAKVQPFSSYKDTEVYKTELLTFVEENFRGGTSYLAERTLKLTSKFIEALDYVKKEDLVKREKEYNASIKNRIWAISTIFKEKQETVDYFTELGNDLLKELQEIKGSFIKSVWEKVPQRMVHAARILSPDSDLHTIHLQLNQCMNQELSLCWESELKPNILQMLQVWQNSLGTKQLRMNVEHNKFLEMMSDLTKGEISTKLSNDLTLASLFSNLSTLAQCSLSPVMILPAISPMRLLTGVQKLIGNSSQSFFYTRYKNYLENNSYEEAVQEVFNQVLPFFEHIEEAIGENIKQIEGILTKETEAEIVNLRNKNKNEAAQLNSYLSNIEKYKQQLNLFLFAAKSGREWQGTHGGGSNRGQSEVLHAKRHN